MSQPIELSEEFLLEARRPAELAARSMAGQIEYWAEIGQAVEPRLSNDSTVDAKH